MSVLIKGMKMPKSCLNCKFTKEKFSSLGRFVNCRLGLGDVVGYSTGQHVNDRHPDCPIVEIPEKHGDLIDRDEVRNAVFHHLSIKGEENLLPAEKSVFGNIIKAKAVIEAEGE